MKGPIVVVGAGQAGASFVSRHVALGGDAPVMLIGEEPDAPYQRPPLSKKFLTGELERDRLWIRQPDWYGQNGITARFGTRIAELVPSQRTVITDSGERIGYGKLVLCTGSRPRLLPDALGGSLDGVHTLRKIGDADRLSERLGGSRRLIVIGGGYIGLEIAASARKLGLEVTVIEMAERILQRVASEQTSRYFRSLHRDHGVEILESTRIARIAGRDGVARGVELDSGEMIEADAVLVGIGALPNVELAEASGIDCENGICVDETCRTSDADIHAAGDCTSFVRNGQRIRLESVQNAADQGDLTARVLCGHDDRYAPVPWFWSEQYDCMLQIAGLSQGFDRTVIRRNSTSGGQSAWYYIGERLIAVDAMNDTKSYAFGRRMLEMGMHPRADQVEDEQTDLKALLQAGMRK